MVEKERERTVLAVTKLESDLLDFGRTIPPAAQGVGESSSSGTNIYTQHANRGKRENRKRYRREIKNYLKSREERKGIN